MREQTDLGGAARHLVEHKWGEVNERFAFYPALREMLVATPLETSAVSDCIKRLGKAILGGHGSFRSRLKEFLDSPIAAESLKQLVGDGNASPPVERINEFIDSLFEHGFRDRSGSRTGGDAVYFCSVILTAMFPNAFVDYRLNRWSWMGKQFDLPGATEQESYGARLLTAAAAAKQFAGTPTFREYFPSDRPLWTAGGLVYLLHHSPELRRLVDGSEIPSLDIDQTLVDAYARFQASPSTRVQIQMRRYRARQLRELLSDPESIDLATFNRDVWTLSTSATCRGVDVRAELAAGAPIAPEKLKLLTEGIQSGELELHGNFMWGSATKVLGPMLPGDDTDRLRDVRRAIEILNDEDLEPLEKATAILTIPGFGPNITTGLVMVFHPSEFAIQNTPSKSAVEKLGFRTGDLEVFQEVVTGLRDALRAEDFLELDYFLYLVDQGKAGLSLPDTAWWVCQGATYKVERPGGYIFAPLETSDGRTIKHYANLVLMRPGQTILHYANGALRAISEVSDSAVVTTRPDSMTGEEDGTTGNLVRVRYTDLQAPIALDEIPEEWRLGGEAPFTKKGAVKQGYAFPVSQSFLSRVKAKFPDRFDSQYGDGKTPAGLRRVVKIAPGEGVKYWDECLKNGYICVGWGQVGDLQGFLDKEDYLDFPTFCGRSQKSVSWNVRRASNVCEA